MDLEIVEFGLQRIEDMSWGPLVHLNLGSILMCNKGCDYRMLSNLHNKKDDSDVATGVDYGVSSFFELLYIYM